MDGAVDREQIAGTGAQGAIYVCSLAALNEAIAISGADYLITLINAQMMSELETPSRIPPQRHLRLVMNDIEEPREDMILPCAAHVEKLIEFARDWNGRGPMLINCRAGRSRSTAAAFITQCALNPQQSEMEIAAALRAASPTAQPNRLLIRLADTALGRDGRMTKAIEQIGEGDAEQSHVFRFC